MSGGAGATVTSPDGGTTTAGTAGSGGRPSGPSAACGKDAPTDAIGKAVRHDLMVTNLAAKYVPAYVSRYYYTTLPTNFDATKQYPVVFYGQGCGQTGSEGSSWTSGHFLSDIFYVQLIPATVTGATVVPSDGSPGCFQAGKQGGADSPDGPYFDQVLAQIEQTYCIDTGKMYVSGSSSGAWLSNYLACARGNVLRGATADSGGLQHDHPTCTGGAAIMEMPGDSTSSIVGGFDIGVGPARDTFIATNGCSTTPTSTMAFGAANGCMVYGNCSSPVVWCNVGGGHQSGQGFIAESSWAFWMTLK
jgi:poly(3-hydroxybutyrate) depolymerase